MSPRRVRELLEYALDEAGWRWCVRWSRLIDEALIREERGA